MTTNRGAKLSTHIPGQIVLSFHLYPRFLGKSLHPCRQGRPHRVTAGGKFLRWYYWGPCGSAIVLDRFPTLENRLSRLEASSTNRSPDQPAVARLYQNQPNPYRRTTTIKYFLPESTASAYLKIYAFTGQEVYSRQLTGKGAGQVDIADSAFPAGTYVYHLLVGGQSVGSKKLVLNQ